VADAQYAIDIAANMPGGAQTLSELDELTQGLLGGGKNADVFQEAMKRVGDELSQASAAAVAANAALAAGEDEYSRLERAALQASKAAEKAGQANAGAVPPELAAAASAATSALAEHTDKLRGLEAEAQSANEAEAKLSATQANLQTLNGHVNKSLAEGAESYEKLRFGLQAVGGQAGAVASKLIAPLQGFAKLSASLGAGTAAAILLTAAVAALAIGLIAGGVAALQWSIGLADSNRNMQLSAAAMQAMHPELQGLGDTYASVTAKTGLQTAALQGLAVQLHAAHVSAKDLPAALEAAADAEKALGNGGASTFIQQIQQGRKSVAALAEDTKAQLGGIVAKEMLSLGAQADTLHRNIAGTFGGLNIDGFLGELANLISDFDSSTALGKQLKGIFEDLFQPLVDGSTDALVAVEAFVLHAAILGVRAYIAFKPYAGLFKDIGAAAGIAAVAFAATFTPAIIGGAVALGGLIATAAVAAAPFLAVGAAVVGVYEAFTHWTEIKDFIAGLAKEVDDLAGNLVSGLVAGISAGAGAVWDAIGGVVSGAIDKAKSLLGIHSPSKVFAGIGDNTVAGFTGAVEAGTDDAHAAVSGLVAPPANDNAGASAAPAPVGLAAMSSPADSPQKAAPAASGGGVNVTIQNITINDVKDAADIIPTIGEQLTKLLEGVNVQIGATGTG
jgi:hypothetical protein